MRSSDRADLRLDLNGRVPQTAVHSASIEDAYVAVMGVTGSGKSSFIKSVTGQDVPIGHGLSSGMLIVYSLYLPDSFK